jgi:outer membrane protein assembly factor BamA
MVGQAGLRYRAVSNSNFDEERGLFLSLPARYRRAVANVSLFGSYRYDTRDSYINPSKGIVLQGEVEHAFDMGGKAAPFTRYAAWFQYYRTLFRPGVVFALRAIGQDLEGEDLPVAVLLPIGGVNTMRGMAQDRFLDSASALINAELRVPLFWRFGGIVGFDAGKVWNMSSKFDLTDWASNLAVGLRFYLETFVVRVDVGFGQDAFGKKNTGFYFNFGHFF